MRALVFLATLAIAAPSMAEPQLLVELRNAELICVDCRPIDMKIVIAAGTPDGNALWSLPISANDVGTTFVMPPHTLDNFAAVLTHPVFFGLVIALESVGPTGPELSGRVSSSDLTHGNLFNNPQVIRHVPASGPNLTGYAISNITQTLNSLDIVEQSPNRFRLDAVSTLHIYGTAIPEPSTLVLISFAQCALWICLTRGKFGPRT
jgi:hypothetical protein